LGKVTLLLNSGSSSINMRNIKRGQGERERKGKVCRNLYRNGYKKGEGEEQMLSPQFVFSEKTKKRSPAKRDTRKEKRISLKSSRRTGRKNNNKQN